VSIDANSRHLRLARRALRTAVTHLRDATGLSSMDDATRERARLLAVSLESGDVPLVNLLERLANEHLSAMRAKRRRS